jgi:hypothetical protein
MTQKVNFSNLTGDDLTVGNTVITGTGVTVGGETLGGSVKSYANASIFPLTNLTTGEMAFSESNNALYFTNGSGWYQMSLVNRTPTVSLSSGSISLGRFGNTADVTYTVSEPEGTPVAITVSNSGIANTSFANMQLYTSNNTITINNLGFATANSFAVTVSASDGVNIGTATANVAVSYQPAGSYYYLSIPEGEYGATSQVTRTTNIGSSVVSGGIPVWQIDSDNDYISYAPNVTIDYNKGQGTYQYVWMVRMISNSGNHIGISSRSSNISGTGVSSIGIKSASGSFAGDNGGSNARNLRDASNNEAFNETNYYIMIPHDASGGFTDMIRAKTLNSGSPFTVNGNTSAGTYDVTYANAFPRVVFYGGTGDPPGTPLVAPIDGYTSRPVMPHYLAGFAIYPNSMTDDEIIADFENAVFA